MSAVVNLERERRRRQGRKPTLALLGVNSASDNILKLALGACDPEDRSAFFDRLVSGTYADMLNEVVTYFEIEDFERSRAVG